MDKGRPLKFHCNFASGNKIQCIPVQPRLRGGRHGSLRGGARTGSNARRVIMHYALCIMHCIEFPHGGPRPDGPHRAVSSMESRPSGLRPRPRHGKSTMTSLTQPMESRPSGLRPRRIPNCSPSRPPGS